MIGRIISPEAVHMLILEPVDMTPYREKGTCRYQGVKDLERERLPWNIW